MAELARRQGVLAAVTAFDPHHWCLLRLQLWDEGVASAVDETWQCYQMGHLTLP